MAKKTTSSADLTEEFKKTLELTKLLDVEVEEELKNIIHSICNGGQCVACHSRRKGRSETRPQTYFIFDARTRFVFRQGVQKMRAYRRPTASVNITPTATFLSTMRL